MNLSNIFEFSYDDLMIETECLKIFELLASNTKNKIYMQSLIYHAFKLAQRARRQYTSYKYYK